MEKIQKVIVKALQTIIKEPNYIVQYELEHKPKYKRKHWFDSKEEHTNDCLIVKIIITKNEQIQETNAINPGFTLLSTNGKINGRRRTIGNTLGIRKED